MITIYSQPDCQQCKLTKEYLENRGINYVEKDVTENQDFNREVSDLGFKSVPVIIADGYPAFIGFSPSKLDRLIKRGMMYLASREFKQVEDILYDFPKLKNEIAKRKLAIRVPYRDSSNRGGSKISSISKPQETYVINLERDKRLNILEEHLAVATEVLSSLESSEYNVISLYYFSNPRKYKWAGVAAKTGYSERQCFNIRNKVVMAIGRQLGYLD